MKLLIVIPALNEELSIQSIIERSLANRGPITARSPVTEVEITVVSDGSTDRTVEIASRYRDQVNLIVFEENRGYGAAIKEAWSRSDADLLGFLDADGTCDPAFFAELCTTLEHRQADVVLGCRVAPENAMPLVRRLGNAIFALLLTAFSSSRVRDTASGMRVVRRTSLHLLMPLPDGLHFTPAMTARAMLGNELTLCEVDMRYYERRGESKLRVAADGLRFLQVILKAAALYRPSRLLGLLGFLFLTLAMFLMVGPTVHYLRTQTLEEWMIYRFIVSDFAGVSACLLLCAGYLTRRIVHLTLFFDATPTSLMSRASAVFRSRWFWAIPLLLLLAGSALILQSFVQRVSTGVTVEHWSRFVVMSFSYSVALILCVTRVIDYLLDLVSERLTYLKSLTMAEAGENDALVIM